MISIKKWRIIKGPIRGLGRVWIKEVIEVMNLDRSREASKCEPQHGGKFYSAKLTFPTSL